MIPEISEFSYGFALTNELVGWSALHSAPIFPSLIEEGKLDGGYDVKLDWPGVPLFLQFKRSDCLTTRGAREIHKYGLDLKVPFYRFAITERDRSFQHISLVSLEAAGNLVFYAAPKFSTLGEINSAWSSQRVAERSIFVSPQEIGLINDNEQHHISFDHAKAYFCSDPKRLTPLNAEDLRLKLEERLLRDKKPVRERLQEWLASVDRAAEGGREAYIEIQQSIELQKTRRQRARRRRRQVRRRRESEKSFPFALSEMLSAESSRLIERQFPGTPHIEIRGPEPLGPEQSMLREISDRVMYQFGAQMFVVQANGGQGQSS